VRGLLRGATNAGFYLAADPFKKISACVFSVTLVSFIVTRLEMEMSEVPPMRAFLCSIIWWASILLIVIGYGFFIWSFSRLGALLYATAAIGLPAALFNSYDSGKK
jgi:hypothetical protein